jgi:oligopeptide transport system substrate-binding protein
LGLGAPFYPVYRPLLEKFNGVHERGAAWSREGNLVSNGAFALAEWTQDKFIVVKRNPFYWDSDNVKLAEIRFYPVDDYAIQERGFRAGQYHVTARFPIFKGPTYLAETPSPLLTAPMIDTHFVTFNTGHDQFRDPLIRRALSLALDRDHIIPAVLGAFAVPAHSFVRPGTGGYNPPASSACKFDPDEARHLFAEAGYPQSHGYPAIDLMLVGNDAQTVRIGETVQAAWKKVLGVQTNLLPTEHKVYLDAERTKHFSAVIERWTGSWDDPTATLQLGESGNPNNDCGWSNARFDQAFRDSDSGQSPEPRKRSFDLQEELLAEEVPYAPLYFENQAHLVERTVQGWKTNMIGRINWKEVSFSP